MVALASLLHVKPSRREQQDNKQARECRVLEAPPILNDRLDHGFHIFREKDVRKGKYKGQWKVQKSDPRCRLLRAAGRQ